MEQAEEDPDIYTDEVEPPPDESPLPSDGESNEQPAVIIEGPSQSRPRSGPRPSANRTVQQSIANIYECVHCNAKLKGKAMAQKHNIVNDLYGARECDHCDEKFTMECAWKKHLALHKGGQSSQQEEEVIVGESGQPLKHFEEERHICTVCNLEFIHKFRLQKHIDTTHTINLQCHGCDSKFYGPAFLDKHIMQNTLEKLAKCTMCKKQVSMSCEMQKHLLVHKKVTCEGCDQTFKTKKSFSHHTSTNMLALGCHKECPKCDLSFSMQCGYEQHMLNHPYQCSFCADDFDAKVDFESHIRTNTLRWPTKCSLCEEVFTMVCAQNAHIFDVHTTAIDY